MSYTAKRLILVLMAWGLIVFVGVTMRINMNTPHPDLGTPTPLPAAAVPTVPDQAAALRAALERNPNDLGSLLALAGLAYQGRDWETAGTLYGRAITLDPHNVDILVHLAAAQLYGQHFPEAEATLLQASTLAPQRPDVHLLLGLAASRQAPPDTTRAAAEWRQVIALAPGSDYARQAQSLLSGAAPGP